MIKFKEEPSDILTDLHLVQEPRRQRIDARAIVNEILVCTRLMIEL